MTPVQMNVNVAQWGGLEATTSEGLILVGVDVSGGINVATIGGLNPVAGDTAFTKVATGTNYDRTVVVVGAGVLTALQASNINAAPAYIKLYDLAVVPNPATHTPFATLLIPGSTAGGINDLKVGKGRAFTAGLAYVIVTGAAVTDTTGVAASEVILNGEYRA